MAKKRFPNSVIKGLNSMEGNSVLVFDKVFPGWEWDDIKFNNEARIKKTGENKFAFFPNKTATLYPKIAERDSKVDLMLCARSKIQKETFFYLDEYVDRRTKSETIAAIPCYAYKGMVDGIYCTIYSMGKIDLKKKAYKARVLEYDVVSGKPGEVVREKKYVAFKAWHIEPDYRKIKGLALKSIYDLSLVWDYRHNSFIWDDVETALILCNIIYMEPDSHAMNMIVCGPPSCKKTPLCTIASLIFGDEVNVASSFTNKSLTPSFYGRHPKLGVLIESDFVCLLDDFLRFFDQQASRKNIGRYSALSVGMAQIFNILDRSEGKFSSGKFDVKGQFLSSLLGTDNMKYNTEMKELWREDPAILKRFTFLVASNQTVARGKMAYMSTDMAIRKFKKRLKSKGLSLEKYRILGHYLREKMQGTSVNQKKIDRMVGKIVKKYGNDYEMEPKIIAIYKFCKTMGEFIPNDWSKNIMFERMVWRLADDFASLVSG